MSGPRTDVQELMWSLPKNLESPGVYELDGQSQTPQQGCHCWTAGWTVCLLRTKWCCMRGSSQQGLQYAFDRFSAVCDQAGTKNSIKKIEVLCLTQGSVFCKWAKKHCSRWRRSSTLEWYSRVTDVGTNRLIHGLVKQTQFCVSFIAPWLRNGRFQRTQSFHFLIYFCSDPHLWS